MKNLKKVLALVLVVATLFGLSAMASATTSDDYSDAASISHIEAVDVMSTIGVFDGISGAFSGDSILTREQAAKIITYMILGKDEADKLVASVAPYTDVARDRWSAGSIAYCKNQGILAGVGNGRFEPNGKLTGVAFAKMCLVALGYDPTIEQLTGSQWAVNTSKLAIAEAGITADLSQPSLSNDMSREDACQMAFNTLQADMVDYENRGGNLTVNGANISMSATKAQPVSVNTGWKDTDRRDGNIYAEAFEQGRDGIQQFAEKYFINLEKSNTQPDAFGRPSIVWEYKADEIGTYIRNDWLVKSWTAKAPKSEMYDAIGGSVFDELGDGRVIQEYDYGYYTGEDIENDRYYSRNRALTVRVDGQQLENHDKDSFKDEFFAKNSSKAAGTSVYKKGTKQFDSGIGKTGNGVLTEVYKNNKGDVWVAIINTYLVQATADFNSTLNRVNIEAMPIDVMNEVPVGWLPTYISGDDFDVSGVKDGDYLLLTVSVPAKLKDKQASNHEGTNSDTTIQSVTPATLQTAAVTEYTERSSVTMGGTKYSYNQILGTDEKDETFAINSEATLVLDTYGYIMYVTDALSSSNFVYIDNYAEESHLRRSFIADAYFADGTNREVKVGKIDGVKIGDNDAHEIDKYRARYLWNQESNHQAAEQEGDRILNGQRYAHWYTFTGSGDGEYTLRTPSSNRYDAPQSALTKSATTGRTKEVTLVKNNTVRFMSDAATQGYLDMYKLGKDTYGSAKLSDLDSNAIVTDPDDSTKKITQSELSYRTNKSLATEKNDTEVYNEINGVRGNANTIFVVKNDKGDVNSYTGIANVPTIKISTKDVGVAKVSWINRRNSDYASYVFIDVSDNNSVTVEDDANVAGYMFTLKDTNDRTYADGDLDYLKYTVWINGKEEERWISATLVDRGDEGILFRNIKEDSRGRITSGTPVGGKLDVDQDGSKRFRTKVDWADNSYDVRATIRQKDDALSILTHKDRNHTKPLAPNSSYKVHEDADAFVNDFYYNSSSNINVVIENTSDKMDDLFKIKGEDYIVHDGVTANFVNGLLGNYRLDASIFLVVTEDDGDVIDTLWIYVTDAVDKDRDD